MRSGNILLTKESMDMRRINESNRNYVVQSFCEMRDDALTYWKDKFYTDDADLYLQLYGAPSNISGVSPNVLQLLQQNFTNWPQNIERDQFDLKQEPRANAGFKPIETSMDEIIYDSSSLESWHVVWNQNHTELVEWEDEIFPFKSYILKIMIRELKAISENSGNYSLDEQKQIRDVRNKSDSMNEHEIVTNFHDLVVRHKDKNGELKAYAETICAEICEKNGYRREHELERLERQRGNFHAERIYSILHNGKFIFLSIDTNHGMLEWCDDDGTHKGERRFDGSYNSMAEKDHGLRCVAEWKKIKL